jgi:SAM-dependent methyltransferase
MLHPKLIIKADDFGRSGLIDSWRRFADLCLNHRALPSIGIVGSDFAHNRPAQLLARYLCEAHDVEFWNHSFDHADLCRLSSAARIEDTRRAQQTIFDVLGQSPQIYGAPFNFLDNSVVADINAAFPFMGIYFSDLKVDEYPVDQVISAQHLLTIEINTQALYPVRYGLFLDEFARRGEPQTIIFQVHPAHWSDQCFDEFRSALQFLTDRGYQVLTAAQFLAARKLSDECAALDGVAAAAPDPGSLVAAAERSYADAQSDARMLGGDKSGQRGYYADRYRRNVVGATRFFREHGLCAQVNGRDQIRVLDVGAGIANWTLAAAAAAPNVTAVAYDRDAELLSFAHDQCARYFDDSRCLFVTGSAERLPLASQEFDYCICNNALNYMQIIPALSEMARVLRDQGSALIGVQNELYPLLGVLRHVKAGQRQSAIDQVDRFFGNRARKFGFPNPTSFIAYWDNLEFITALSFAGFYAILQGISLPDDYGSLFGTPALWGYLIRINWGHRDWAVRARQGSGITSAHLETLIGLGARDLCVDILRAAPALADSVRNLPALIWQSANVGRLSLEIVMSTLEREGVPISAEIRAAATTIGQCVLQRDWRQLAAHFRAVPNATAEYCCAKWFAGLSDPTEERDLASDDDLIFELGTALRTDDKARFMTALRTLYGLHTDRWRAAGLLAGADRRLFVSGRRPDPAIQREGEGWLEAIEQCW